MPSDPNSARPQGAAPAVRRLGVALLNATLLLAVIALALALTLAVQVRGIVADGRSALRAEIVQLERQLDATRQSAAQALAALEERERRAPPPASPGAIPLAPSLTAPELAPVEEALNALLQSLADLDLPVPDASARNQPDEADDAFFRWLTLTIIRHAAGRILADEPGTGP